jgi:hypothetical protein
MRNFRNLALTFLFLALPSMVHAQNGDGNPKKDDLLRELEILKTNNEILRADFARAMKEIDSLRNELNNLNKKNSAVLEEIRTQMIQIDQSLAKLQPTIKSESKSPPQSGRVLLANHYVSEMTFYINEKPWVVPAKATVLIENVPAGTFSYRVVHATFGQQLSDPAAPLAPGKTFTLTAK